MCKGRLMEKALAKRRSAHRIVWSFSVATTNYTYRYEFHSQSKGYSLIQASCLERWRPVFLFHSVCRPLFSTPCVLRFQQTPACQPEEYAPNAVPHSLPCHAPQAHHNRVHSARYRAAYHNRAHCPIHALPVERQHRQPESKVTTAEDSDEGNKRGWRLWRQIVWF